MKCTVCDNNINNKEVILTELYFGFHDDFPYLKCGRCGCLHIEELPENLAKYYPENYYSFHYKEVPTKYSSIRKIHYQYFASKRYPISGAILSKIFKPSGFHFWLKNLGVNDEDASILDIGCGNGFLIKRIYRLGFEKAIGIDPFMEKDQIFNDNFKLLKKDIFEINDTFDFIMMHHSLEHMFDQKAVIKKLNEILKPDGKALIRIPIISEPLMDRFGKNVVSLDPPRHLCIHTLRSITELLNNNGLEIYKTEYDAEAFSIKASEQYQRGIGLADKEKSYIENPAASGFTTDDDARFEEEIKQLNASHESDNIALYIKKSSSNK